MLFFLTITGAVFLSFWSTSIAKYVRDGSETKAWSSTFVLGGSLLSSSIYTGILWLILLYLGYISLPTSQVFWYALIITVLLNILFEVFRFKAYALTDMALIAPFAAISPLLSIFSAWILIRELPTLGGAVGILLVVFSIYSLYLKDGWHLKKIFAPFISIWTDRGTRYAFFASIPPAISIVFDKKAVAASDPVSFSFLAIFFIALGSWMVDLFAQGRRNFIAQFNINRLTRFIRLGFFHFVAGLAFNAALLLDVVPHISALRRVVIVFEIILGYFILKQRIDLTKRLICGIGVVLGVILIGLFRK